MNSEARGSAIRFWVCAASALIRISGAPARDRAYGVSDP
jgi:hypothetical protein